MKIRIRNSEAKKVIVILEPWVNEYDLNPGDHLEFVASGEIAENAYFDINYGNGVWVVTPEWPGAVVAIYNSQGGEME